MSAIDRIATDGSVVTKRRVCRRVAIVDENPWNVRALTEELARESFQPVGFTSARSALAALASHGVDVLLTAHQMAEMDGLALVRTLRERDGERAPVCMIGVDSPADVGEELRAAADEWIARPYAIPAVVETVRRLLVARPAAPPKRRRNGARWLVKRGA